jgi:15-cis-phytoene desaturase
MLNNKKVYDVIVVGAGISGLSCAVNLASSNKSILLLEENDCLGGRISSWVDNGMEVVSGIRWYLGSFKELNSLINQIGLTLDQVIELNNSLKVLNVENKTSKTIYFDLTTQPLKTLDSFLRKNGFGTLRKKFALLKFTVVGVIHHWLDPQDLDNYTLEEYASKRGFSLNFIRGIIRPLTIALFLNSTSKYSAYAFFSLVALNLSRLFQLKVGTFKYPLRENLIEPIGQYLENAEVIIKKRIKVEKILIENGKVVGVRSKNKDFRSQIVVVATNLGSTKELIKASFTKPQSFFKNILRLKTSQELSIQFKLEESVLKDHKIYVGAETILNTLVEQQSPNGETTLMISLYPADKMARLSTNELLELVIKEALKMKIDLRGKFSTFRIIKNENCFYSLIPGSEHLRPSHQTPIEGLFLAGDYTKQRSTIPLESSVLSGKIVADLVLSNK